MGDALIDELIGRGAASRGQVEEAQRRLDASGGRLVERLVEVGVSAERLLTTLSATTGLPAAPRSALARPRLPVGLGVSPATWLQLAALPFGTDDDGNVLVAITDPADADRLETLDLPDFVVHLALADAVRAGLLQAFPELEAPVTLPGGVKALPLDDEGARVPGDELPTTALPKLSQRRDLLDPPPTNVDRVTGEHDALRRLADQVSGEGPRRTLSGTLDLPLADLDDEGGDFDGPTQAVDASLFSPFTPDARPGYPAVLPTQTGAPASEPAFDDYEPKTQAMSIEEMRASLKARGAPIPSAPSAATPSSTAASPDPGAVSGASADAELARPATTKPQLSALEEDRLTDPGPDEDDEFEPKTVAMSLGEVRASLQAVGALAASTNTADGPDRKPVATFEDAPRQGAAGGRAASGAAVERAARASRSDVTRPPSAPMGGFDYSAAADEFDDGEGREEATSLLENARAQGSDAAPFSEHDEIGDDDVLFIDESTEAQQPRLLARPSVSADEDTRIAEPAPSLPPEDDFDEATIAADALSLEAEIGGRRGIPSAIANAPTGDDLELPEHDADDLLMLDDDEAGSGGRRKRAAREDEADLEEERALAAARTKMQAALDEVEALEPADEQHSSVFSSGADEDEEVLDDEDEEEEDEDATEAGAVPVLPTRVSAAGLRGRASEELSSVPTAAIPMLNKAPPGRAPPVKSKGVDTAPTGPIAVRGYDVKDVLGAGGMATVYRAFQRSADREVALKILSPHLSNDAAFVARFQREIRSSASLTHPNIIRVFDYGDEAGIYYMATEVMDSGTLRDALHDLGPLPVALTVKLLEHLLRGIGHAHKRGMVHRDIKPANLMLSSDGLLKIGDFGIAKSETDENLTRTGALFGTPAYMSPEQALGRTVDFKSDLFACGIIGYELLTGENPYQSDTASAALLKVSRADPPPLMVGCPAAPPLLVDAIARLQRREPSERQASAEDALADLKPLIDAIDERWPDLVTRYTADPRGTVAMLKKEHAEAELLRARSHLGQDPPLTFAGAQAAYLATVLDPDNRDARQLLAELSEDGNFNFGVSLDARVHDAERSFQEDPRAPGLLRRISDLYRAGGNPFKAALWLRQYLTVKPTDSHAQNQLAHLTGPSQIAGFDRWEAPAPKLDWGDLPAAREDDDRMPEDTQVPSASAPSVAEERSAESLDLRPIGYFAGAREPPPPAVHEPTPAGVRPALALSDPSEMMKAATSRARGGLQVMRSDLPPAAPDVPALQAPQPTFAVPRAPGRAPTQKRALPKLSRTVIAAAAAGLGLVLLIIIGSVIALSGEDVDVLVAQADPGESAAPSERQRKLLLFARERLAEGDGVRALQAAKRAHGLGSGAAQQGEALLMRGRAYAAVGDPEAAKKDFLDVMSRFPDGNLLHLEAKQQLRALPK